MPDNLLANARIADLGSNAQRAVRDIVTTQYLTSTTYATVLPKLNDKRPQSCHGFYQDFFTPASLRKTCHPEIFSITLLQFAICTRTVQFRHAQGLVLVQ